MPDLFPAAAAPLFTLQISSKRYNCFKQTVQTLVRRLMTCPRTVWGGLGNKADWCPNELKNRTRLFEPKLKLKDAVDPTGVPQPISWDWRAPTLDKVMLSAAGCAALQVPVGCIPALKFVTLQAVAGQHLDSCSPPLLQPSQLRYCR